jgi:hypothetical protein
VLMTLAKRIENSRARTYPVNLCAEALENHRALQRAAGMINRSARFVFMARA